MLKLAVETSFHLNRLVVVLKTKGKNERFSELDATRLSTGNRSDPYMRSPQDALPAGPAPQACPAGEQVIVKAYFFPRQANLAPCFDH